MAAAGFADVHVESIREDVFPAMAKYVWQRVQEKKKMNEVVVDVTEDDRARCRGVSLWERANGFADYVIASARKPLNTNDVGDPQTA
ncbi:MAG: hypothetical protein ACREJT_06725 [Myxococcota bacterium]